MKILRLTLLTALVLAAPVFSASAQTKVAAVDLKKIFNGYWKTKQADAALASRTAELRKELKDMEDNLDKAQTDYKNLLDQANDPAISAEERDKRKLAAADKGRDIASSKTALEEFQRQADAQLNDQSQRMRDNLLVDIQKAVADKAQAGGFTMVVNSGLTEEFLYLKPDADLTEPVLSELNAGAPIDLNKPVSGAPSSTSTNLP